MSSFIIFVAAVATGASFVFVTVMLNAVKFTSPISFDAVIIIFASVPTLSFSGVPFNNPFTVLKVAQVGLFVILQEVISPLVVFVSAWNEYVASSATVVAGVPLITGAFFAVIVVNERTTDPIVTVVTFGVP